MTQIKTEQLALEFAKALVNGEFELAYSLLAESLKAEYSPASLQQTYQNMISYFLTPPDEVRVEAFMDDWQSKQTSDIGWAYVSILSDGEAEAVTVIVCQEQEHYAIRSIEWFRP